MDHKVSCECGRFIASFSFRDNIMPSEVVNKLYCPECSKDLRINPSTMIVDNGWIVEYDMDVVKFASSSLSVKDITPDFVFDQGYCTWRGLYPTDYIDSLEERQKITKLSKTDPKKYFEEIKNWSIKRIERLRAEGWRKINGGENIWI